MEKIGIMGGTFNPIHNAHVKMGKTALSGLCLDKVLFIPDKKPPHKKVESLMSDEDRSEMVKLAIAGEEKFEFSDIELKRDKTTYTSDTLLELKEIYQGASLYFIMGSDSFAYLDKWHEPKLVFENATIVVIARKNAMDASEIEDKKAYFEEEFGANIEILEMPFIEISSTEIREMLKNRDKRVLEFINESVFDYICNKELYMER